MCRWGKLWTIRYKKATNQLSLLRCWEQKQGWSQHPAPPRGRADHLSHSSGPTHQATPTLTPFKGPARPASGSEQGHLFLVFSPLCSSTTPSKALLGPLVWPVINFDWLQSPRTRVGFTPATARAHHVPHRVLLWPTLSPCPSVTLLNLSLAATRTVSQQR